MLGKHATAEPFPLTLLVVFISRWSRKFKTGLELSVAREGPKLVIFWPEPYVIWDYRPVPPGLALAQYFCVCLCAYIHGPCCVHGIQKITCGSWFSLPCRP